MTEKESSSQQSFSSEYKGPPLEYPEGWKVPDVSEQIRSSHELLPQLDLSHVESLSGRIPIPQESDGIAILPKLSFLGRHFGITDPYGEGYGKIGLNTLDLTGIKNELGGWTPIESIHLDGHSRMNLEHLEKNTPGDVIVKGFNSGRLNRGHPATSLREQVPDENQLPLGFAQTAFLLKIMPGRLTSNEDLKVDCASDKYDSHNENRWWEIVQFSYRDGRIVARFAPHESFGKDRGAVVIFRR